MNTAKILDFNGDALQGAHNRNPNSAIRLIKRNTYRDLSTVWITPTRDHRLDDQVVFQSWMSLQKPMNQKFSQVCIGGAEIADAYNCAIELILRDDIKWKYMLTVEVDNLPPADGLLKLYENITNYDAVGGLYWLKGEDGAAMIYGNPADAEDPNGFTPQPPIENAIQPCNGLGMGFTLFNVDMFRKMDGPWFNTTALGVAEEFTQDLWFFKKAKQAGFKFASDNRVKVGHLDFETRKIW